MSVVSGSEMNSMLINGVQRHDFDSDSEEGIWTCVLTERTIFAVMHFLKLNASLTHHVSCHEHIDATMSGMKSRHG